MNLARIRILFGISIFAGLLFCGWWTFREVSSGIDSESSAREAMREWAIPIVVYVLMLILMASAIVYEIRGARRLRASKDAGTSP